MHLLYYHQNCADGFAALCIAHAALLAQGVTPDEIRCRPIQYGWPDQIPDLSAEASFVDDHIWYLDYTPPADQLATLVADLATWNHTIKLTIIDHHEKMAPLHQQPTDFESVFDLTKSGASLTWEYFHTGTMPAAVSLIARRDLGHAWQDTDDPAEAALNRQALDLHAYLFRLLPRTLEAWNPIIHGQTSLTAYLSDGQRLRSADRSIIDEAAMRCHWLDFRQLIKEPGTLLPLDHIPAVNGLGPEMVSDACDTMLKLYAGAPFAASWWTDAKTGRTTYSLRSRKENHPDGHTNVNLIAQMCDPDGGGHPCAAGFSTTQPVPLV